MKHFVCVTCGTQFAAAEKEPDGCPVCLDERQYVGHGGQKWATLDEYRKTHKNVFAEEEKDLHTIHRIGREIFSQSPIIASFAS